MEQLRLKLEELLMINEHDLIHRLSKRDSKLVSPLYSLSAPFGRLYIFGKLRNRHYLFMKDKEGITVLQPYDNHEEAKRIIQDKVQDLRKAHKTITSKSFTKPLPKWRIPEDEEISRPLTSVQLYNLVLHNLEKKESKAKDVTN